MQEQKEEQMQTLKDNLTVELVSIDRSIEQTGGQTDEQPNVQKRTGCIELVVFQTNGINR